MALPEQTNQPAHRPLQSDVSENSAAEKAILLRVGDGGCPQDAVGLIRPLSRQYRATESWIVGSSPNRFFCFWRSWLT